MRALFICAVAFMAMVAAAAPAKDYDALFAKFKKDFNRQYASVAEEASRRAIFERNMRDAAELERQNPKATFGLTPFSDVDPTEFKNTHRNADFSSVMNQRRTPVTEAAAGSKIDWRDRGAVTPIKNQLNCGGCWSFSTTGNIEGQWFLAGNSLTSLSEQQLLSCDRADGNNGCHGGNMVNAWEWLVSTRNGQIDTEASYPFTAGLTGKCSSCTESGHSVGATINGHKVLPQNEDQIAAQVYAKGPVSIGVDSSSMQSYTGGIMTNCVSTKLDHAVLIVGYDNTASTPYWIIKNQWGASWGEQGYFRVQMGTNQCGLKEFACTSTVAPRNGTAPTSAPSVPQPPAPPAPTQAPSASATFTQKVCTSSTCTSGCQSHTFSQNQCLRQQGGGSATVSCNSNGMTVTQYYSSDCSGTGIPSQQPVNQCAQDESGSYVENSCSNVPAAQISSSALFRKVK